MAKPPPRLFVDDDLGVGLDVILSGPPAHYLGTVLRLGIDADVLLFNGRGGEWRASIAETAKRKVVLRVAEQTREQIADNAIDLLFAPIKRGPMETLVQKATELGVRTLQPVITARTVTPRTPLDRLCAIAVEAAEQCERLTVPEIREPIRLADAWAALPDDATCLFCDEAGDDPSARWGGATGRGSAMASVLTQRAASGRDTPWALLVGPEGGFTPQERDWIREQRQTLPVSLGPRILKAETAGIVGLAMWQGLIGDA